MSTYFQEYPKNLGKILANLHALEIHLRIILYLNEAGDKVKRQWLIRWFKDPESYIPGSAMGDFHLTDTEIKLLTDYLMSFKRDSSHYRAAPKNKVSLPRG